MGYGAKINVKELDFTTLEEIRNRCDMITSFKTLKVIDKVFKNNLFKISKK